MRKFKKLNRQFEWHLFWFMFWDKMSKLRPCTKFAWYAVCKASKHSQKMIAIQAECARILKHLMNIKFEH